MAILDRVHSFTDLSVVSQSKPKVLPMPRLVAQEFVLLGVLAPLMCSDLSAKVIPQIFATDASDGKGAIVKTEVPTDLARGLWRSGRKKGGYTRMLSREQALLAKIDEQWEEEPQPDPIQHPSKPLALRYHFIEICGGAGKITKFVDQEGLVDRSPAFDFCLLKLLSWLCFMVEGGRLDSFFLAPLVLLFPLLPIQA